MTYLVAFLILIAFAIFMGKTLKATPDRWYPDVEDDDELEAILAHSLSHTLSKEVA